MSHSLILYQRITGDFYTIISEGKFTLSQRMVKHCMHWKREV